tara:strand:+ start:194 stop:961 length:768 start_codon:yes stop_codon:yes gene_type:complete
MSINFYANKLANAFLQNKLISPIPAKYTRKISNANSFRKLCESKIKRPIVGFKAGGTGLPLIKKLGEKEPFYASVFKHNVLKNNSSVKKNNFTLGIELEVCYIINKNFFKINRKISKKDLYKLITHIGPCIEVVGYRQKKKGIKSFGDLCSDFGGNVKFILGKIKKFKKNNVKNLKTNISNLKIKQFVSGNTNTVYLNPMNSLLFVLKKLQKDKIKHNKDFFVFTGSSVGVVPILAKGIYTGKINKLGTVKAKIN